MTEYSVINKKRFMRYESMKLVFCAQILYMINRRFIKLVKKITKLTKWKA